MSKNQELAKEERRKIFVANAIAKPPRRRSKAERDAIKWAMTLAERGDAADPEARKGHR